MSAQKMWKHFYRQIVDGTILLEYIDDQRDDMRRYRRAAALERKLEAANRRIAELEEKIMILESDSINEYMSADTLKDLDDMKIAERLAKIQQAEIDLVNTWHERA